MMLIKHNPVLTRFINRSDSSLRPFLMRASLISVAIFIGLDLSLSPRRFDAFLPEMLPVVGVVNFIIALALIVVGILFVEHEDHAKATVLLKLTNISPYKVIWGYIYAIFWGQRWLIFFGVWTFALLRVFWGIHIERIDRSQYGMPPPTLPPLSVLAIQLFTGIVLGLAIAFMLISGSIAAASSKLINRQLSDTITPYLSAGYQQATNVGSSAIITAFFGIIMGGFLSALTIVVFPSRLLIPFLIGFGIMFVPLLIATWLARRWQTDLSPIATALKHIPIILVALAAVAYVAYLFISRTNVDYYDRQPVSLMLAYVIILGFHIYFIIKEWGTATGIDVMTTGLWYFGSGAIVFVFDRTDSAIAGWTMLWVIHFLALFMIMGFGFGNMERAANRLWREDEPQQSLKEVDILDKDHLNGIAFMRISNNPILKRFIERSDTALRPFLMRASLISVVLFMIPVLWKPLDDSLIYFRVLFYLGSLIIITMTLSLVVGSIRFVGHEDHLETVALIKLTILSPFDVIWRNILAILWTQRWIVFYGVWAIAVWWDMFTFAFVICAASDPSCPQVPHPTFTGVDVLFGWTIGFAVALMLVSGAVAGAYRQTWDSLTATIITIIFGAMVLGFLFLVSISSIGQSESVIPILVALFVMLFPQYITGLIARRWQTGFAPIASATKYIPLLLIIFAAATVITIRFINQTFTLPDHIHVENTTSTIIYIMVLIGLVAWIIKNWGTATGIEGMTLLWWYLTIGVAIVIVDSERIEWLAWSALWMGFFLILFTIIGFSIGNIERAAKRLGQEGKPLQSLKEVHILHSSG